MRHFRLHVIFWTRPLGSTSFVIFQDWLEHSHAKWLQTGTNLRNFGQKIRRRRGAFPHSLRLIHKCYPINFQNDRDEQLYARLIGLLLDVQFFSHDYSLDSTPFSVNTQNVPDTSTENLRRVKSQLSNGVFTKIFTLEKEPSCFLITVSNFR